MKRIFTMILLAGAMLAAPRWYEFATGADGSEWYVDTNSVQYSNDRSDFKVWTKEVEPDKSYMTMHLELDRDGKRWRALATVDYKASGVVARSDPNAGPWTDIPPDSIVEGLYEGAFYKSTPGA